MVIRQALNWGVHALQQAGITGAALDAQILLCHCLSMGRTELVVHADLALDEGVLHEFTTCIERRSKHEPVAYILGRWEFWSLDFEVTPDVLIPRPETEFLLETVIRTCRKHPSLFLQSSFAADLCCGSGIIAVVLAKELGVKVVGVDISLKALAVARKNSILNKVQHMVFPLCCDLFLGLSSDCTLPLIVSNPPYVSTSEVDHDLEPDVADYEPRLALDGGVAGLEIIQRLAPQVLSHLAPGGLFFMEFGAFQGASIKELFSMVKVGDRSFVEIEVLQDYSGRDRVLQCQAAE